MKVLLLKVVKHCASRPFGVITSIFRIIKPICYITKKIRRTTNGNNI